MLDMHKLKKTSFHVSLVIQLATCIGTISHQISTQQGVYDRYSTIWASAIQFAITGITLFDLWLGFTGRNHKRLLWAHLAVTLLLGLAISIIFPLHAVIYKGVCFYGVTGYSCDILGASLARTSILWGSQVLSIAGVVEVLREFLDPLHETSTGKVAPII
ncbi:hypothetical protein BASA61_005211 [Batrachochytrium salamandrivorans]|nr:hypothetical protein BASA60_003604 [Batrachochytrium salamandrivorans]KAH6590620.1 hypothetical protein BASA61_005211 [Batrachochytrium salamandrivorans]KAH9265856.1 hypothetical protein BASA84_001403 [Batrachochytrium salamandrivorans]